MPVVSLRFVHNFSNFRPFKWEVNNARECRTLDKGLLPNPDYERASRILTENIAAATLRGWQSPLYGRIFYDTFHSSKRARPSISQIRGVRDANQHSFVLCRVHQSDENVSSIRDSQVILTLPTRSYCVISSGLLFRWCLLKHILLKHVINDPIISVVICSNAGCFDIIL